MSVAATQGYMLRLWCAREARPVGISDEKVIKEGSSDRPYNVPGSGRGPPRQASGGLRNFRYNISRRGPLFGNPWTVPPPPACRTSAQPAGAAE